MFVNDDGGFNFSGLDYYGSSCSGFRVTTSVFIAILLIGAGNA